MQLASLTVRSNSRSATGAVVAFLQQAGGNQVVALPYFIGTLGLSFLLHFVGSTDLVKNNIPFRVGVILVSHVFCFGVIFLINFLARNLEAHKKAIVMSAAIAVGAFVRAFMIQQGMHSLGLSDGNYSAIRVVSGTLLMATMMMLVSIVFGLFTEHSSQTELLRAEEAQLRRLLDRTRSRFSKESNESANQIKKELLGLLGGELDMSSAELSARLRSVVEDGVRPLINRILESTSEPLHEKIELAPSRFKWVSVLESLRFSNATNVAPLFIGVIALIPWDVRSGGALFALQSALVKIFLMTLSLGLARLLALKFLDRLNRKWNLVFIPIFLTLFTLPYNLFLMGWNPNGLGVVMTYQAIAFVLTVGIIFAIWGSVRDELARVIELRRLNNDKIRWEIAHLNGITWATKRNLARQLHGAVQSEIISVLLRIAKNESEPTAESLDSKRVQSQLRSRLELILSADSVRHDFNQVLQEIVETWEAISEVHYEISDAAVKSVGDDPLAAETSIEIIREAVSNAIRHGQSKRIWVKVGLGDTGDCINIDIESEGKSFEPGSREGLGTQQLRDCTVFYSVESTATGTKVSAAVPFRAEPQEFMGS